MKKPSRAQSIIIIVVFLLAAVFVQAGIFYWNNLRGVGPALTPPPQDISKLITLPPVPPTSGGPPHTENTTGMPLKLPEGFSISIFAKDLGKPRVVTLDPAGRVLVSIPASGKVVALPDENTDGVADKAIVVVEGLNRPHGMAVRCAGNAGVQRCALYIAESDKVVVYDYDQGSAKATNKRKLVDLPDGGNHFTRTIMFMPVPNENKLLIAVGSTCNVCNEKDWRRAKILLADVGTVDAPKVGDLNVFASGLRNSVFMALHRVSGKIWATEMGRDLLGDNIPPDEINIIEGNPSARLGISDYGWPICYGKNVHDSNFDKNQYIRDPCADKTSSYIDIQAHSAPLGLAFIPEEGWPQEYWYNLLVAYHGSWNRTVPTGYKVVRYKLDSQGKYIGQEDFITGWLTKDGALGRPVDIVVQPGGYIYISDAKAGVIYRVTRN